MDLCFMAALHVSALPSHNPLLISWSQSPIWWIMEPNNRKKLLKKNSICSSSALLQLKKVNINSLHVLNLNRCHRWVRPKFKLHSFASTIHLLLSSTSTYVECKLHSIFEGRVSHGLHCRNEEQQPEQVLERPWRLGNNSETSAHQLFVSVCNASLLSFNWFCSILKPIDCVDLHYVICLDFQ